MSVSNYVLNQRISAIQYEIDHLPVGTLNLDDVLTNGNDAGGQDIINVDNLACNTINGNPVGGSQNLDQVLTVGNTATNKNIVLANATGNTTFNPAYIQHTNTVGNDLSISSNQNITMSADNIDMSQTRIIFPSPVSTNFIDLNAGTGSYKFNNSTGGTVNPVISLNQTGSAGGVLVEEIYNARTATTGEFNRMSFYAKTSTGGKNEYARMHTNAVITTTGATRGRLDFDVNVNTGTTNFLSLNGNTQQVDINNSNLHLNNNNIVGANIITSTTGNQFVKGTNNYYINNDVSPTAVEDKLRWVGVNLGKSANWTQATSINNFGAGAENITASINGFGGYWVVGTEGGNVYYSSDSGANWTLFYSFGGRINCFSLYNSGNNLMIGGNFSGTYNFIASMDTGFTTPSDPTGTGGLNGEVKCFYDNAFYSCLYIGGAFDAFFGGTGQSFKFITYNYGMVSWYYFNNYPTAGFTGGTAVKSISVDSGSSFVVVCGDFTDENTSGGSIGIPYCFTWNTSDGYTVNSYFGLGIALNGECRTTVPYGSGALIGGAFSNTQGYGSCNSNYAIYIAWTGSSWDLQTYPYLQPTNTVSSIVVIPTTGDYFTVVENGATDDLYYNNIQTPSIPTGQRWNCITYNGSFICYATNNQTTVGFLFYQLDQSVGVNIVASGLQTFNTTGGSNFTNCYMTNVNSAFEMIYRSASNNWYVISQESCNFS